MQDTPETISMDGAAIAACSGSANRIIEIRGSASPQKFRFDQLAIELQIQYATD
jgi:hypothetical protein